MPRQWVRLPTNILDDTRHRTLTLEDEGVYLLLLALAGIRDHRDAAGKPTNALGALPSICRDIHADPVLVIPALDRLLAAGLLTRDALGCYYLAD